MQALQYNRYGGGPADLKVNFFLIDSSLFYFYTYICLLFFSLFVIEWFEFSWISCFSVLLFTDSRGLWIPLLRIFVQFVYLVPRLQRNERERELYCYCVTWCPRSFSEITLIDLIETRRILGLEPGETLMGLAGERVWLTSDPSHCNNRFL